MARNRSERMNDKGQGELALDSRAKRSRMGHPHGGRGAQQPTKSGPPGRRVSADKRKGAEFVADPLTTAEDVKRRQLADALERIALRVGVSQGALGFALWLVRDAATIAGILDDGPTINPRALSWLGALLPGMARRGLLEKLSIDGRPQYDTSNRDTAHGNKNVLWVITHEGRKAAAR